MEGAREVSTDAVYAFPRVVELGGLKMQAETGVDVEGNAVMRITPAEVYTDEHGARLTAAAALFDVDCAHDNGARKFLGFKADGVGSLCGEPGVDVHPYMVACAYTPEGSDTTRMGWLRAHVYTDADGNTARTMTPAALAYINSALHAERDYMRMSPEQRAAVDASKDWALPGLGGVAQSRLDGKQVYDRTTACDHTLCHVHADDIGVCPCFKKKKHGVQSMGASLLPAVRVVHAAHLATAKMATRPVDAVRYVGKPRPVPMPLLPREDDLVVGAPAGASKSKSKPKTSGKTLKTASGAACPVCPKCPSSRAYAVGKARAGLKGIAKRVKKQGWVKDAGNALKAGAKQAGGTLAASADATLIELARRRQERIKQKEAARPNAGAQSSAPMETETLTDGESDVEDLDEEAAAAAPPPPQASTGDELMTRAHNEHFLASLLEAVAPVQFVGADPFEDDGGDMEGGEKAVGDGDEDDDAEKVPSLSEEGRARKKMEERKYGDDYPHDDKKRDEHDGKYWREIYGERKRSGDTYSPKQLEEYQAQYELVLRNGVFTIVNRRTQSAFPGLHPEVRNAAYAGSNNAIWLPADDDDGSKYVVLRPAMMRSRSACVGEPFDGPVYCVRDRALWADMLRRGQSGRYVSSGDTPPTLLSASKTMTASSAAAAKKPVAKVKDADDIDAFADGDDDATGTSIDAPMRGGGSSRGGSRGSGRGGWSSGRGGWSSGRGGWRHGRGYWHPRPGRLPIAVPRRNGIRLGRRLGRPVPLMLNWRSLLPTIVIDNTTYWMTPEGYIVDGNGYQYIQDVDYAYDDGDYMAAPGVTLSAW